MRLTIALAVITALAVVTAQATDPVSGGNAAPSDDAVTNLCGERLARMFAQFGTPTDAYALRGSTPDLDGVIFTYGTYAFTVRDKTVHTCWFMSGWTGTIKGIKIGDSQQDVEKVLGTTHQTDKTTSQSTLGDFGFDLKDLDAVFWAEFDKNNKVYQIEVDLNN
jgi:hypothetical protein